MAQVSSSNSPDSVFNDWPSPPPSSSPTLRYFDEGHRMSMTTDRLTGRRYEPIDVRKIEFLYRGDPGLFIFSIAGCVYHWCRQSKISPANNTPKGLKFKFNIHRNFQRDTYARIYHQWMVNSAPKQFLDQIFLKGSDGERTVHPRCARAIYLARIAFRDHGVEAARHVLDQAIRTNVTETEQSHKAEWYRGLVTDDLREDIYKLWAPIIPINDLIQSGHQTTGDAAHLPDGGQLSQDLKAPQQAKFASLQQSNHQQFHKFFQHIRANHSYIDNPNRLHLASHHSFLPFVPGSKDPYTAPADFNRYQDWQSNATWNAQHGNLMPNPYGPALGPPISTINTPQVIKQASSVTSPDRRPSLIVRLKLPQGTMNAAFRAPVANMMSTQQSASAAPATNTGFFRFLDDEPQDLESWRARRNKHPGWPSEHWDDEEQGMLLGDVQNKAAMESDYQLKMLGA